MQDQPSAIEILAAVADFLRQHAMPQLQGHTAFHARVAANALDIVRRELEIAPQANAEEHQRLRALLGADGSLEALNEKLCEQLENGALTVDNPDLVAHLRQTTMTKLAIDQPAYSAYRRALAEDKAATSR
ncbi:DUF6285 domain-containing protein [Vineibacter terrae]|uniref:DUF6285 domain-containing protein n=1 Tax=Vineibacter terrae TaxID=2586908 RepID=UPI002E345E7B|nr:DUF6285 domain-containing protein [Vineibacter terrae]HEX2889361.1 DUF6285 domain-containing protein [Vineibacter terrae]